MPVFIVSAFGTSSAANQTSYIRFMQDRFVLQVLFLFLLQNPVYADYLNSSLRPWKYWLSLA